jgi:hypothetical protein
VGVLRGASGGYSSRFSAHQFVEIASLSASSFVLHQQSKATLVELVKPFVPGNFFELALAAVTGKIEANHSNVIIVSSPAYAGRVCAALFRPAANFVVIGEWSGGCRGARHNFFSFTNSIEANLGCWRRNAGGIAGDRNCQSIDCRGRKYFSRHQLW